MFYNIKIRLTFVSGIMLHFCQCDEFRVHYYTKTSVASTSITVRGFDVHKTYSKHKGWLDCVLNSNLGEHYDVITKYKENDAYVCEKLKFTGDMSRSENITSFIGKTYKLETDFFQYNHICGIYYTKGMNMGPFWNI